MPSSYSGSHHYNPNEPRDDRGRWTSGEELSWAEKGATMRDRTPARLVRALLLVTRTMSRDQTFETFDRKLVARVIRVLRAWNAASALDDRSFAARFFGPDISLATAVHLRAAARVLEAATYQHVAVDADHLLKAVETITPARWPSAFNDMEARAIHPAVPVLTSPPLDWDGTSGDYGDNTRLGVIKGQINLALKTKKAIALVGGAGDERFSHTMLDVTRDMTKQYPGTNVQYFTNDQGDDLKDWLQEQGQAYSSDSVAVIGHSWGGGTSMSVVANGVRVGSLITIDPVPHDNPIPPDRRRRDSGPRPPLDLERVRKNSGEWININANPDTVTRADGFRFDNWIAGLGGAWNSRPKDYAHHHYNANINHGEARNIFNYLN